MRFGRADSLLVPTEAHVEACATAGIPALTLRRLVQDLARAELGSTAPTTPESTRLLVARIRELPVRHAHALDQTIGSLRRAGTSASALARTGLPRGKYFAELFGELDRALETRSLYDDRSSAWAAARRLARVDGAPSLTGSARVRGLSSWDNATLTLLETLDEHLRRQGNDGLVLELPVFQEPPLQDAVYGLASELETRWADRQHSPSLAFVAAPPLSSDRVDWIEAYDAESEARAVARTVLEALSRGTALDRIAVVPVELEEAFLEPLRFELSRAKIPFAEPRGRPAIASPRAHAAIELLRMARGPLSRDALVDVLRVPELRESAWFAEHSGALGELLHEVSLLPLRFDRTGTDFTDELADQLAEIRREDPAHAERLAPAHQSLLRWLAELGVLAEPGLRSAVIARSLALFESLGLMRSSERTLARALAGARAGRPELLDALGHDAAGARAVRTALERMSAAAFAIGAEGDSVRIGSVLDELELALEGVSPTGGAVRAGAVRIVRPRDVAGLSLDHAVLCRASDAALDSRGRSDFGLGAEVEARLPLSERPTSAASEQRFTSLAVAWALSSATRISITWSSHSAARAVAPSRLARLLQPSVPGRREPASPLFASARPAHTRSRASEGALHRISVERRRAAFFADPQAPIDAYNGQTGPLGHLLGGDAQRPLSVTALERSLRCPFLGFTTSVLRATFVDPVEDAISARERGNLLHAALARALESVRALWGQRSPTELEQIAIEQARTLLEQRGRSPLRRAGLESTLTDVTSVLRYVLAQDDGYRFHLAEQAFGSGAAWSSLPIGEHFVTGRADRIDLALNGESVRVVDYKTRLPTKNEQQRALQPALYALKAASELGAEKVEFAYLALQGRNPQARTILSTTREGEPIRAGLASALIEIRRLESGFLPPRPAASSYCVRCQARDICRRPLSAPEGTGP